MNLVNRIFAVVFLVCGLAELYISTRTHDKFFAILGVILILLAGILYLLKDEN